MTYFQRVWRHVGLIFDILKFYMSSKLLTTNSSTSGVHVVFQFSVIVYQKPGMTLNKCVCLHYVVPRFYFAINCDLYQTFGNCMYKKPFYLMFNITKYISMLHTDYTDVWHEGHHFLFAANQTLILFFRVM